MSRFRLIISLESIVVAVPLFMLLVPVVGLFHSCPANGCPNASWPAWYGSITYSLWSFGVAFGGNDVMTFSWGVLGPQFIYWCLVAVIVVSAAAVFLGSNRLGATTGTGKFKFLTHFQHEKLLDLIHR